MGVYEADFQQSHNNNSCLNPVTEIRVFWGYVFPTFGVQVGFLVLFRVKGSSFRFDGIRV